MIKYLFLNFITKVFAGIGALWTLTEITVFISPTIADIIKKHYWIPVCLILAWAIYNQLSIFKIKYKLCNSDVEIEIKLGNLLKSNGDKVIGVNTNFDTMVSIAHIHPKSLHGQFIRSHYRDNVPKLDSELALALSGIAPIDNTGSLNGKPERYNIGQVAQLNINGCFYYLLAYADLSQQWKAETSVDNIKDSIAKLWVHIYDNPISMNTISVPIFGTNFSRLGITRANIVKEIIKSFLAMSRDKKITNKLSVIVYWSDFKHLWDDWVSLDEFVKYESQNAQN